MKICYIIENKTKDQYIRARVFYTSQFVPWNVTTSKLDLLCPVDEFLAEATLKQNPNETVEPILIWNETSFMINGSHITTESN